MCVYELRVGSAVGRPTFDPVVITATFDSVVDIVATAVIACMFAPVID